MNFDNSTTDKTESLKGTRKLTHQWEIFINIYAGTHLSYLDKQY
jgi:hypothetical protein